MTLYVQARSLLDDALELEEPPELEEPLERSAGQLEVPRPVRVDEELSKGQWKTKTSNHNSNEKIKSKFPSYRYKSTDLTRSLTISGASASAGGRAMIAPG